MIRSAIVVFAILTFACSQKVQTTRPSLDRIQLLCGTVQFGDACGPEIDSLLALGIALYHHMTFEESRDNFQKAIDLDPECMWGYWGKALSYLHPIWPDRPSAEKLADGGQNAKLAARRASTEREKLFSNALIAYYQGAAERSESERLATYEKAWEAAFNSMPEDLEAKSFYILSHLSIIDPSDKTYARQIHAGALAETILDEIPDHPAGFHYVIHAYDYPPLASKALDIARNYGKVAPQIPHALHMPTHIFTRLGYWDESIDWNIKSAKAALQYPVNGSVSLHHFHALDYLVYGYLQKGQDDRAQMILDDMMDLNDPFQATFPTAYALAAIPARIALERKDWVAAAQLNSRQPSHFEWDKFPEFEAMHDFARGLGAARSGNVPMARDIHNKMTQLQSKVSNTSKNTYWQQQIEIQKIAVDAWILHAEGDINAAIARMRESAEMESSTSKNPVTPGEVLPARELLADMYAASGQYAEALENYEQALERSPNRFNSLIGALQAAQAIQNAEAVKVYRAAVADLTREATSRRVRDLVGEVL